MCRCVFSHIILVSLLSLLHELQSYLVLGHRTPLTLLNIQHILPGDIFFDLHFLLLILDFFHDIAVHDDGDQICVYLSNVYTTHLKSSSADINKQLVKS